jgi:hypothetical protein
MSSTGRTDLPAGATHFTLPAFPTGIDDSSTGTEWDASLEVRRVGTSMMQSAWSGAFVLDAGP